MLFSLGKYRYYLSNQQIMDLNKTFLTYSPNQIIVSASSILQMLKVQGIYMDQKQLQLLSSTLFKQSPKSSFNVYEFICLIGRKGIEQQTQSEFKKVFSYFDVKNCGRIMCQDIKKGFIKLGEGLKDKELDGIFVAMDIDADGKVDFQEFMAALIYG